MNFYQMDVDSIERHYRNTNQSIPDVVQALIDKLKDTERELNALRNVLDKYDYSDCPPLLDEELHDVRNQLATYADESKELDRLREEASK
jgi:Asp-tRNA(Asn)/Glu-tRNA(Gln) amidotransferase A subunit family amidase